MMGRVLEGTFLEGAGMAESPAQGRKGGPAAPQLRLDELLEGLQAQVEQVRATRDRVHTLLDAVLSIGTDLDLDVVLRRITESAVTLVDAQYGALGVLGEEGKIRQFITVGMDESTIEEIGHYPEGKGILGLLIREPEPLRLPDLGRHHDSVGFPAGHPPMTTFLGAPVRVRDQVFGNLYLTDKRGGAEFDDDDEAVLRTLAAAAGVAIDNARLYENSRRREQWLAASSDLTRSLLSGTDPDQVLYKVASTVSAMVVPGSAQVKAQAESEGLDEVFRAAGFDWRSAGCSMCLGMNPDTLDPGERCASTSNRNFEGRQGRGGRTHLVSPKMAAAAAIEGRFVDIREWS